MANKKTTTPKMTDVVTELVNILTPFSSDERKRVIAASLMLLGEPSSLGSSTGRAEENSHTDNDSTLPKRAKIWTKQNELTLDQLEQVFHFGDNTVEVIATGLSGNNKEKVKSTYILAGLAKFLETDNPNFDDASARTLCTTFGCFDSTNHSKYISDHGNDFTGSKAKGWTLTAPGLKRGAALIKELSKE